MPHIECAKNNGGKPVQSKEFVSNLLVFFKPFFSCWSPIWCCANLIWLKFRGCLYTKTYPTEELPHTLLDYSIQLLCSDSYSNPGKQTYMYIACKICILLPKDSLIFKISVLYLVLKCIFNFIDKSKLHGWLICWWNFFGQAILICIVVQLVIVGW